MLWILYFTVEQTDSTVYYQVVASASHLTSDKWLQIANDLPTSSSAALSEVISVCEQLLHLRQLFTHTRDLLRKMGHEAGVEIVPDSQLVLVEATEALPGVLCAGLPGAGGNDAIFAITMSAAARHKVELAWSQMGSGGDQSSPSIQVCPLLLRAEGGMNSGVRGEFELGWD